MVQYAQTSGVPMCTVSQGWIQVWHLASGQQDLKKNKVKSNVKIYWWSKNGYRGERPQTKWKIYRSTQSSFSPSHFSKSRKANRKEEGNTKACVLIFSFRAPPGPLKLLWFPQSNYISTLNPSRIVTSHQGTLSAYKRSMPNGVPEVDFISLLQSNGLWYFPKLMAALPPESTQRCMGPKPATWQLTASPFNNRLHSLLLSMWNKPMASPPPSVLISASSWVPILRGPLQCQISPFACPTVVNLRGL